MTVTNVTLSNPKPRTLLTKVVSIARTDSSTLKCVLPKGAVIANVRVLQVDDAVTAAGSFVLGWSGATSAILGTFSMATTKVGLVHAGTAIGTVAGAGTAMTSDRQVISTYTVGSSTAGGTGYVFIDYFIPGPGEAIDD
jgi:hypothetical protein